MAESEEARQRRYRENRERQIRMGEQARREIEEQKRRNAEEEKTIPAVNRQYLLQNFGYSLSNWPDVGWTNDDKFNHVYGRLGKGAGWSLLPVRPGVRTSAKRREQFTDFQVIGGDFPVVSAPLLALLRRFDAAAIEAVPVDVTLGDGSVITDGYFLCDVTKRLPIFDLERMRLKVVTIPNPDMSHPWTGYAGIDDPPALWGERMPSLRKAFLRPDIPADAHLFRDAVRRTDPYVSRALWEAIRAAGFIGLGFEWPDHLSQPPA